MLFGHSWGAYSVGSVLNIHPDIKAVVMIAGFNEPLDILREEGQQIMGDSFRLLMPYFSVLERVNFGPYSSYNSINGFDASNAGVMIIHSLDDGVISFENQFQMFLDKYRDDMRFDFVQYKDRGHDHVHYTDASRQYRDELHNQFKDDVNTLEVERTAEIEREYMEENVDKAILFELDVELMDRIVSFYDNYTSPR